MRHMGGPVAVAAARRAALPQLADRPRVDPFLQRAGLRRHGLKVAEPHWWIPSARMNGGPRLPLPERRRTSSGSTPVSARRMIERVHPSRSF